MRRLKRVSVFAVLSLLFVAGLSWAASGPLKVGDEAPWFVLPSSDERLVDYGQNYFGKHHLIITFFPAAFTPV